MGTQGCSQLTFQAFLKREKVIVISGEISKVLQLSFFSSNSIVFIFSIQF